MTEKDKSNVDENFAQESHVNPKDHNDHGEDLKAGRRANLRRLLVGGGVIGSSAVIPDKWSKAVVQSVVLPTHAQSSGVSAGNFNGQGPTP